jgi:hypothetical protein
MCAKQVDVFVCVVADVAVLEEASDVATSPLRHDAVASLHQLRRGGMLAHLQPRPLLAQHHLSQKKLEEHII